MRPIALALLTVLLGACVPAFASTATPALTAQPAPDAHTPVAPAARADVQRVDLAHASWTRNGESPESRPAAIEVGLRPPGAVTARGVGPGEAAPAPYVRLPFDGPGVRWGRVFSIPEAAMMRMELQWLPGPDGALFEVILDGQRLSPARDGWRPTERALRTDLGPMWLGQGNHLLEFVSREDAHAATLRLSALWLSRRGGD